MPTFRPTVRGVKYSQALAQAYASASEEAVVLDTLEFRHPAFLDENGENIAARVVNDHIDLSARLEADAPMDANAYVVFKPVRFGFTRMSEAESAQAPTLKLVVSNVARLLVPHIHAATQTNIPVQVTWRQYIATDLTAPHIQPVVHLTLRAVSAGISEVSAEAGFADLANRRFPAIEYTADKFPGLVAR